MERTAPFVRLGDELRTNGIPSDVLRQAEAENEWFTEESVRQAADAIASAMLTAPRLEEWLAPYPPDMLRGKRIGIVMAGNIPMVGFADLLAVLAAGGEAWVKYSSKDRVLMEWIAGRLQSYGGFAIRPFRPGKGSLPDAAIATGSDNTNRYFRSLFAGIPSVLRGSRTSCALLTGSESDEELRGLRNDVFSYFGLGCRNVTHLFVPQEYDFTRLAEIWRERPIGHPKFRNAYRQSRALAVMRGNPFIDGGYFTLHERSSLFAPLTELTFEHYADTASLTARMTETADQLQCIVASPGAFPEQIRTVAFGEAQRPGPGDWADGVNLFEFLGRG